MNLLIQLSSADQTAVLGVVMLAQHPWIMSLPTVAGLRRLQFGLDGRHPGPGLLHLIPREVPLTLHWQYILESHSIV